MQGLDLEMINQQAEKSRELIEPKKSTVSVKGISDKLNEMSKNVMDYFQDSPAILIQTRESLHEYVDAVIQSGYAGIDTETTGLDRVRDYIVGASLYYPGGVECYIPMKHRNPIVDTLYKDQLTYEEVQAEFQRLADAKTKLIFANADFDLSMIYKDLHVDFCDACYYDVILAWRCLKEDEKDNALKVLYSKYVLKGKGDPKKFRDFFTPEMFPFCKPEIAKLYAANDAKITFELFKWQLPYVTRDNPKCKKHHLEAIAALIWDVEFPLIKVCQQMHRTGIYLDKNTAKVLVDRYSTKVQEETKILSDMVDELIANSTSMYKSASRPFRTGAEFNPKSPVHVKYLLYTVMNLPEGSGKNAGSTNKEVLKELNLPVTRQILKVRSLHVLISTFVEKLPKATTGDSRIHAQFKQIGADTGRMSCIAGEVPIRTLHGEILMKDISVGDEVFCYDENLQLTTERVTNKWLTGHRECKKITCKDEATGELVELICTPEHPIRLSSGEWIHAEELSVGDSLLSMEVI